MKIPVNHRFLATAASLIILAVLAAGLASASPFAKPSEASGIVIMNTPRPAHLIFPVRLVQLDGQEIPVRDNGVWLKPGPHQLRLVAGAIDADMTGGVKARQRQLAAVPQPGKTLAITIEAGKKYYVGYDVSDTDPKNWGPVLWQVK